MTRETKAGLVVASSFLCLVATVVAVKLREEETPGDDQPEVAAAQPAPAVPEQKLDRPVAPVTVAQPTGQPLPAGPVATAALAPVSAPTLPPAVPVAKPDDNPLLMAKVPPAP